MEDQNENLAENHTPGGKSPDGSVPDGKATDNSAPGAASPLRQYRNVAADYIKTHRRAKTTAVSVVTLLLLLFMLSVPVYIAPALQHSWGKSRAECRPDSNLLDNRAIRRQMSVTRNEITRLERRLASYVPTQTYIVINTVDNRFSLYRNRQLVREGYCSSGSYTLLKTEEGDKEWIFKTPRGRLSIQGKITQPVWRKPDWAFIEEGLPVPGPTDPSRYEYGVLGKYAMSLGDGYLIHGTLYQRQLGMPVTHGCIRLGDEDLEAVFHALSVGSRVYIY
jgi:hypothetical protein